MKKVVIVFVLLICFKSFSQIEKNLYYLENTKPNDKNNLSLHFKNAIPFRLLKKINYPRNVVTVNVAFYLNKFKEPYNIKTNFKLNKDLEDIIVKAFLQYPIENLGLKNFSTKNRYSFQILASTVDYENIIYCSSIIVTETPPIYEACKDLNFYEDIKSCINSEIKNHINKRIDSLAFINAKKKARIIKVKLKVDKKGKLILIKDKNSHLFSKAVNNFPIFDESAKLNDSATTYNYTFYPSIRNFTNLDIRNENLKFKSNSTNTFAKFISEKLEKKYIENSGLSRVNKILSLNFELDKKGRPYDINTNARSYKLDKRIIEIFQEYPIENLNLGDRSTLAKFYTTILKFNVDKTIVETFPEFLSERVPVFPGCEKSINIKDAKKCFSKNIQTYFAKKFDNDIANRLGLSKGRKRILISFKVNKEGKIDDIHIKSPHSEIKEQIIYLLNKLPKMKPGLQRGKPVGVKYSIPFSIIVI